MKRLVLLGGGHAHCEVLAQFARSGRGGTELVLVSPARHAVYSGMVPGWIAGDYPFGACRIDLDVLAAAAGALRIEDRAVRLEADARRIVLQGGREIDYDLLSLDVGSTAVLDGLGGAEHGIALRPIDQLETTLQALDARARRGRLRSFVVVGGGAAGIEVLLALHYRLSKLAQDAPRATLVSDGGVLLPGHGASARRRVAASLDRANIVVRLGVPVCALDEEGVRLADGTALRANAVILATGAAPHPWLATASLAKDAHGFVAVDACLRSLSHDTIWGAGDAVTILASPTPKAGVYAVRQGPVLAQNLGLALEGRPPRPFDDASPALAIFNTGGRRAIASWRGLAAEGSWVWRWKDWLDRRFVKRYAASAHGRAGKH